MRIQWYRMPAGIRACPGGGGWTPSCSCGGRLLLRLERERKLVEALTCDFREEKKQHNMSKYGCFFNSHVMRLKHSSSICYLLVTLGELGTDVLWRTSSQHIILYMQ